MITASSPLILASASPRRRALIAQMRIPVVVRPTHVGEVVLGGETPDAYLARIVDEKFRAACRDVDDHRCVLVADTEVIHDGQVLGKPENVRDAKHMLERLSGRAHDVATRFTVGNSHGARSSDTVSTRVMFRALTSEEIDAYVATGEGADKAGGYAIQGIGAFAVARIEGSYSNVVGLPVAEVVTALLSIRALRSFPFAP